MLNLFKVEEKDQIFLQLQIIKLDPAVQLSLKTYFGKKEFKEIVVFLRNERKRTKRHLLGLSKILSFFEEFVNKKMEGKN